MRKILTHLNIQLEEENFDLLPWGAAYWQEENTLLLADSHLGKVHFFNEHRIHLPESAFDEQLKRLNLCIDYCSPQRIIVLGDMFHHERSITEKFLSDFNLWRNDYEGEILCIAGNHDRYLTQLPINRSVDFIEDYMQIRNFILAHDVIEHKADKFQLFGHRHPRYLLKDHGGVMNLPCFWRRGKNLIFPAFSSICSGTSINRELKKLDSVYIVVDGEAVLDIRI